MGERLVVGFCCGGERWNVEYDECRCRKIASLRRGAVIDGPLCARAVRRVTKRRQPTLRRVSVSMLRRRYSRFPVVRYGLRILTRFDSRIASSNVTRVGKVKLMFTMSALSAPEVGFFAIARNKIAKFYIRYIMIRLTFYYKTCYSSCTTSGQCRNRRQSVWGLLSIIQVNKPNYNRHLNETILRLFPNSVITQ